MNRRLRLATAALAAFVLSAMLGLAAVPGAPVETWAGVVRLFTCGVLMLATVGAFCRRPRDRPPLAGFAAFGWGYFAVAHWFTSAEGPLPTVAFLPGSAPSHAPLLSQPPIVRIVHDAWTLAFAVLGGILAGRIAGHGGSSTAWRRTSARPLLLGLIVLAAGALLLSLSDADLGAGAVFLATWALMGLAVLGAVLGQGRRREVAIGAASFGLGYLVLAFGPVFPWELPTDHLLHDAVFRPGGPSAVGGLGDEDEESRRIRKTLERPVSLHFPKLTELRVILDVIRNAIRRDLGRAPEFYAAIDELRLSPEEWGGLLVTIDREDIPANEALRLCLVQVGLTYHVQSGYLRIVPDAYRPVPFEDDPVMIAGHSLLALIAGMVGGVLAPLVAGSRGRNTSR